MKFVNRWKIEGTLTTQTPLRIGDGDDIKASKRGHCDYLIDKDAKPPVNPLINAVALDNNKKPYIPASAIKGNLRTWGEKNVIDAIKNPNGFFSKDEIEIIFGSPKDTDPKNLKAGKVQFSNAYFQSKNGDFSKLAGWSSDRLTAVSVGIAVNRKTRTASDKKLFHQEFVPEGITFKFELSGNDYQEESLKDDDILSKLLILLKGFANGVTVGAETADAENSWGKLEWNLTAIKRSTEESVKKWFENSVETFWEDIDKYDDWKSFSAESVIVAPKQTQLSLSLQCLDDFLVNDPSKTKRDKNEESDKPNHSPLRNKNGNLILPKSSIKGAIRSQAERILRTMAIKLKKNMTDEELKKIACYPDDMKHACSPIKKADEVQGLCLACQLFGASGWKSPISFTDFTATEFVQREREFVAIDRFTGGVSGSGKFNAEVAHKPVLKGDVSIDFARLSNAPEWAIGLLALTFRDLIEGDIRLGFGRAKGFGEIKSVKVEKHNLKDSFSILKDYSDFKADLEEVEISENIDLDLIGNSDFGMFLQLCVEQLVEKIEILGGLK